MLKYTSVFYDLMIRSWPYMCIDQWSGFVHSVRKYTSVHSRTPPYIYIHIYIYTVLANYQQKTSLGLEIWPSFTWKCFSLKDPTSINKDSQLAPRYQISSKWRDMRVKETDYNNIYTS
ncbi:hypothetical protein Hanom_Chr09g00759841 [Helianthus anomalus]